MLLTAVTSPVERPGQEEAGRNSQSILQLAYEVSLLSHSHWNVCSDSEAQRKVNGREVRGGKSGMKARLLMTSLWMQETDADRGKGYSKIILS